MKVYLTGRYDYEEYTRGPTFLEEEHARKYCSANDFYDYEVVETEGDPGDLYTRYIAVAKLYHPNTMTYEKADSGYHWGLQGTIHTDLTKTRQELLEYQRHSFEPYTVGDTEEVQEGQASDSYYGIGLIYEVGRVLWIKTESNYEERARDRRDELLRQWLADHPEIEVTG